MYDQPEAAALQPGQKVYPVRRMDIHGRGAEYIELRAQPARTNLSHEPRTEGWIGTTNDVEATALGEFEVVSVKGRFLADGRERIDVKVQ